MKKYLIAIILSTYSMVSFGANYQQFINPNSLGKDIHILNKKYKLSLKLSQKEWGDNNKLYQTPEKEKCLISVETTQKGKIQSIAILGEKGCQFGTTTPLKYQVNKMTVRDILNQVKPNEVYIEIGCFNCPSRIEIIDNLIVDKDDYRLSFEVDGYHTESHIALSKLLLGNYEQDKHYEYMDKLDELFRNDPELFQRDDIRKLLFKYFLNHKIHSYEISWY